jgi:hypothetical protein
VSPRVAMRSLARYSRAATPWGLTVTTAVIAIVLLSIVARWPAAMWPLHGATIGLLAAVSAWSVDERCSAIVDLVPRPLWWRTVARAPAALLLVAVWVAMHLSLRDRLPDHLGVLVLQGVSAVLVGFAVATWQRTRGNPEPGQRMAMLVCPAAVAIALAKPWSTHVPVFPIWPHENWPRATAIWSITGGVGVLVLIAAIQRDAADRAHR